MIDKLLRVRKNLPTTIPVEVSHAQWIRLIAPMFSEDQLIDQFLVELKPANVIEQLNKQLEGWEKNAYPKKGSLRFGLDLRPTARHGIYLADDDYGLLVTDMSPGKHDQIIEIKPKWLAQSPSAPKDSKRCRQCARIARENAIRAKKNLELLVYFCPLDLLSKDQDELMAVSRLLLGPVETTRYSVERMAYWLESNTILKRIQNWQRMFDKVGPLVSPVEDENFLCAMTLRDCSVYLRFPSDAEDVDVEARIGDLDLKSKDKKQYWQDTEKALIDGGWYQGLEEDKQPLTCQLSRSRG